ncbi:NUDIX domain-containing protein [Erwinia sp. CPCC 100877]|nr:NUDIX domain-containing protein [Erwinia sp. CPCC 100877]
MIDVYNSQRKKTGKVIQRGAALAKGEYQLAAAAVVVNQGKFLITQRHPEKPMGLLWEVPGGAVEAGETSCSAALRELKEETGIEVQSSEFCFVETICYEPLLQPEEVIAARFASFSEIKELQRTAQFTPFDFTLCHAIQKKRMKRKLE